LELHFGAGEAGYMTVLALELLGHDAELSLDTLFVGTRGAQHQGPEGPGRALRAFLRWQRHDFEVGHAQGALPVRGADAVAARIAATDDDDFLSASEDGDVIGDCVSRDALVLLGEEIHRIVNARELATRYGQVARNARTDREANCIE